MQRLAYGLVTAFLSVVIPAAAVAQTIERTGDGDVFIDDRIDRLLRRGNYVALHDPTTTIPAGDTVRENLLVLGGDLYLEGVVVGDLVGIDANLYLRPGSRVQGDVVNVGGGLYRSELAEVGDQVGNRPNLRYQVLDRGDRIVIVSHEQYQALDLGNFFGLHIPEYDRVDGFLPRWGFTYTTRPVFAGFALGIRPYVGYRTEPGEVVGGGSAFLERGGFAVEGGWSRDTRSQDRWIRSDLRNSADFLLDGDDMRNYYGADVTFGEVRYRFGQEDGDQRIWLGLRYQEEDGQSRRTHNPWTIFGDDTLRFNPPIDNGTIRSFIPFVGADWLTASTATDASISVEQGESDLQDIVCDVPAECAPGEGSFTRLRIDSEFAMLALLDHTLEIELQFMMPIGGDEPLPRQRFGMLGGSSTIRTVPDAAFYGDHLAYSETEYIIPIRAIRLPRDIVPEFQLLHMAGLAWVGDRDDDEDFVQNVGARLNIWALYARWLIDPANGDQELTAGVSWPFDQRYPWQEEARE